MTRQQFEQIVDRFHMKTMTFNDITAVLFVVEQTLPPKQMAPRAKPTGRVCSDCFGVNLIPTGTCMTCQDCGSTTGCG